MSQKDLRKTSWSFKQSRSEKKLPQSVQLKHIHDVHPTLEVFLKCGRDLIICDSNGFSDPYCIVSVGDLSLKSEVKRKTLNPDFNEMFDFSVTVDAKNRPLDSFNIQVWDKDFFKSDYSMLTLFNY
jgi:Ca2+-dependent lipid-binding protein